MSTPDSSNAERTAQPADVAHGATGPQPTRSPAGEPNLLTLSAVFAALICALWLVYGGAIHAPFIYDDKASVMQNPSIVRIWPLFGDGVAPGPLTPLKETVTSGRPLVNLSLALNYRYGRLDPTSYHVVNLLIHALNATILFAVMHGGLRSKYFAHRYDKMATGLSFVIALIWAMHPLQTESVEYISQRTELMVAFFYLFTLYGCQRYFTATGSQVRGAWLVVTAAACALGACCKEVMVTAPVLMLLYDRTFESGTFRRALARHWPLYVGLLLSWGVILAINIGGQRTKSAGFHFAVTPLTWWVTQARVLVLYCRLVVWPWPLVIHHDVPFATSFLSSLPWLAPVGIAGLLVLERLWRNTAIGYLGAWVFIILSPTLVVPIITEVAAERRMYLPLAAFASLAVALLYEMIDRITKAKQPAVVAAAKSEPSPAAAAPGPISAGVSSTTIALACAGAVALVLAGVSMLRLAAYSTEIGIWQDAVERQPDSPICRFNLGIYLFQAEKPQEAIPHLLRALELYKAPEPDLRRYLGAAFAAAGLNAEAIEHLQVALEEKPDEISVRRLLGVTLLNAGRTSEAVVELERVVKAQPDSVPDMDHLAAALINDNRPDEAIEWLQAALRLKPEFFEARFKLALACAKAGRMDDAAVAAEQALAQARQQGAYEFAAQVGDWLKHFRENPPAPTKEK